MSILIEAESEAAALEWLHENGRTDGLPVIIPTKERVARMALASGLDPALSLGAMGPGGGDTTVHAIATNAVMAGCLPDHMPVVLAAIQAMLDPAFDLPEMQSTTHSTAPLLIVNGPIRQACGIASGFGALGPGHRANASIGRAVRLCMINIGGAVPGVSDMALLGHPGKFTFCLAEDEEQSPWPPLHTSLGYLAEQSVAVVVGAEAPHSCIFQNDADDPTSADRLLRSLAATIANLGSNNAHFRRGHVVVTLNPEQANVLHAAGIDRAEAQRRIHAAAVNRQGLLAQLNPAFVRPGADPDVLVHAVHAPEDILLFVAGGSGLYATVFPSWAAGAHANPVVHHEIVTDQACEIPGLSYG